MKNLMIFLSFVIGSLSGSQLWAANANAEFWTFCQEEYKKSGTCPAAACQIEPCQQKEGEPPCQSFCLPRRCTDIKADECPLEFCDVLINCSNQKMCHYKMFGEKAKCGDLAYAGQDVECCKGFVRRCGIEFLDGRCDLEGQNSVYNLPICIPCGDGVCSNFEDRCNCPEDCKGQEAYRGLKWEERIGVNHQTAPAATSLPVQPVQ